MSKAKKPAVKPLHPRNPHRAAYDLNQLAVKVPALKAFIIASKRGGLTLDFAQPDAVKALNQALLHDVYKIKFWDIPQGALCPAVPGRADYIHYLADLLALDNQGIVPEGATIRGLDIGMGANCIYPLIGTQSYGWNFVGSDINPVSVNMAQQIVKANAPVRKKIDCRLQSQSQHIFTGIIQPTEFFHFTLCNPPFHASEAEAVNGTQRKLKNLSKTKAARVDKAVLNFAGQGAELWCQGGELAFVQRIVEESRLFKQQCLWFTCLVSKKSNLPAIHRAINKVSASAVEVVEMAQGQKQSRFIAWSFFSPEQRQQLFKSLT